jgi:uncharacterized protein
MIRIVFVALAASALATCSGPPSATAPGPQISVLTIRGEGEVKRTPNIASVFIRVQARRDTAGAAMKAQAEQSQAVIDALKAKGVVDADLQTTSISLQPTFVRIDKDTTRRQFSASNSLQVTFRDISKLGEALDAVVTKGGLLDYGISFDVDAKGGAETEARTAAVKDALSKAEAYAAAMNYKVVRVIAVSEPGAATPPIYQPVLMEQVAPELRIAPADVGYTPIQAGELTTRAEVNASFELAPK